MCLLLPIISLMGFRAKRRFISRSVLFRHHISYFRFSFQRCLYAASLPFTSEYRFPAPSKISPLIPRHHRTAFATSPRELSLLSLPMRERRRDYGGLSRGVMRFAGGFWWHGAGFMIGAPAPRLKEGDFLSRWIISSDSFFAAFDMPLDFHAGCLSDFSRRLTLRKSR